MQNANRTFLLTKIYAKPMDQNCLNLRTSFAVLVMGAYAKIIFLPRSTEKKTQISDWKPQFKIIIFGKRPEFYFNFC